MKIGFGRDANWQAHLDSATHSKNKRLSIKPSRTFSTQSPKVWPRKTALIPQMPGQLKRLPSFLILHCPCCDSPGCYLTVRLAQISLFTLLNLFYIYYHLRCQGLIQKPAGGWFCDDECKRNARFTVQKWRRQK